jgi:hypothetical protein
MSGIKEPCITSTLKTGDKEALEKYKRDYVDKSSSLNLQLKYLDKKRQLNRKIIQIQKIYSKLK